MTASPPTVRALHGVVVLCLVPTLVGCGGSSARFELNEVYIKKQEELVGEEFTRRQREDIESALTRLFGTPEGPQLPDAAAIRDVLDPATLKTAAALYRKSCSHCHGITGDGAGREAKDLDPYPRDYRRGIFKYKSTPKGVKPTDADLRRLLYNGIPGTKMPRFGSLDEVRLAALIQYVKYLSIRGEVERALIEDSSELEADVGQRLDRSDEYLLDMVVEPVAKSWQNVESQVTPVPRQANLDAVEMAESIRRGWRLFYGEAAGCAKCHGDPPLDDEAANDYDDWSKELEPSRLTPKKLAEYVALGALPPRIIKPRHLRDGVFHGGKRPEDIYRRILNGIDGTPMPAATVRLESDGDAAAGLSRRDIWDLVHYVLNMPNQPVVGDRLPLIRSRTGSNIVGGQKRQTLFLMRIFVGKNIGRLIGLILVTVFAVAVMLANLGRNRSTPNPSNDPKGPVLTKAPVSVLRVEPRKTEILLTSSGMIRPFERYTLAFETAGRVAALGKSDRGQPLDDGDRVRADQILAVLDQRILVARKQETAAQLEQAQSDLQRARDLRSRSPGTVTDAEYQEHVTAVAVAKAQAEIAQKNLEDATLRSPVDGVISKRYVNAGESVTPQQVAFEIVQVDDVLLVVGVPESRVGELESRRRAIAANRTEAEQARRLGQPVPFDEDDLRFKTHVQLIGRDRYGRPWPKIDGEVYRIGETADDKTGLFEVEILLPNREGKLKPGQIAVAEMVIDRITACRVPLSAALFQGEKTYLFTVEQDEPRGDVPGGKVGRAKTYRARRYELDRYIEQGEDLIIPDLPEQYRTAVVRGQYRIFDGRPVEIVPLDGRGSGAQPREDSVPAPVIGTRP